MMRNLLTTLASFAVFLLATFSPTFAQSSEDLQALKKEIQTIKESQTAIQKDLQEIKTLLKNAPAAPGGHAPFKEFVVDIGQQPTKGKKDSAIALLEFSDYQCPFCSRHVRDTAPQLDKEYVQTGKVRHVFMEFPLENIHPLAFKAAQSAEC